MDTFVNPLRVGASLLRRFVDGDDDNEDDDVYLGCFWGLAFCSYQKYSCCFHLNLVRWSKVVAALSFFFLSDVAFLYAHPFLQNGDLCQGGWPLKRHRGCPSEDQLRCGNPQEPSQQKKGKSSRNPVAGSAYVLPCPSKKTVGRGLRGFVHSLQPQHAKASTKP